MADKTLKFIIDAENRATQKLAEVNKSLEGVQGKMESLEPTFKKMAAVGTVAFGAIATEVGFAIKASQEAAEVQSQLYAVLQSTGGAAGITAEKAISLSKALQTQSTFGDEAILSAENLLLTFTDIKDNIFPDATKTVLDMSVALGQDTKSSAIQLGKALQDPIIGVTALRRVGVNFNDDQMNLIKTLTESGNKLEAQKMILSELGKEFGGSAKAQTENFAGKMKQLNEQFGDMQESIGNAFIPVIEKVIETISPVIQQVTEWAEKNPELTSKIIIITAAIAGLVAIVGTLGLIMPPIIAGFAILTGPIGLIALAIGLLIAAGYLLITNWQQIKEAAFTIWNSVVEFLSKLWEGIISYFRTAWDTIKSILEFGAALAVGAIITIFQLFGIDIIGVFTGIISFFQQAWNTISAIFTAGMTIVQNIWTKVSSTVRGALQDLLKQITDVSKPLVEAWDAVWKAVGGAVEVAWSGIKNIIKESLNWVIDKINMVINALNDVAQKGAKALGISVPTIANIPRLAQGGIVSSPTLAMIGEAGPEAVIPLNRMAGAGVGGITVNIYGDFYGEEGIADRISRNIMEAIKANVKL